jgi:hypothetical protein
MSKSSKPKARNQHSDKEQRASDRLGFMQGEIAIPDDFDLLGKDQIADLFEAVSISTRDFHFNRKDANKR